MQSRRKGQTGPRFIIYLFGLLIMSFGTVLLILADLGASPWDVLHIGLYYQFGLTIGSWNIITGFLVLAVSALLLKAIPQFGAFLNMILVGLFIDMYMLIPFLHTPLTFLGQVVMFVCGLLINCYGMGIYISAQFGAGPRDSLMLAITSKTRWKVGSVRGVMEVLVLVIGWKLGGPVFWGTIMIGLMIGMIANFALPQCQTLTDRILIKLKKETNPNTYQTIKEIN